VKHLQPIRIAPRWVNEHGEKFVGNQAGTSRMSLAEAPHPGDLKISLRYETRGEAELGQQSRMTSWLRLAPASLYELMMNISFDAAEAHQEASLQLA